MALSVRLYPVITHPEQSRGGVGMFGDSFLYHNIAVNLYKGNGFSGTDDLKPNITRPPLYPLFMSGVYRLFGKASDLASAETLHHSLDKVRMVQCILDALICLVVFAMVRTIYAGSFWPAILSAFLYCFSFYNIFYTRALLAESLTTFFITLAVFFTALGLHQKKILWYCCAGAALGLTTLTRPEYILFAVFLALLVFGVSGKPLKIALVRSAAILLTTLLVVAPWTLRNYITFKKFIPVSVSSFGMNLFSGTYESNTNWSGWDRLPKEAYTNEEEKALVLSLFQAHDGDGTQIEASDRAFLELALKRIRKDPLKCFSVWLARIPRLWYQNAVPLYRDREASGTYFIFYFIFAVYAFFSFPAEQRLFMAPAGLLFIYLTLIFLPSHIEPRYGVGAMPPLIGLTGLGLWKLVNSCLMRYNSP